MRAVEKTVLKASPISGGTPRDHKSTEKQKKNRAGLTLLCSSIGCAAVADLLAPVFVSCVWAQTGGIYNLTRFPSSGGCVSQGSGDKRQATEESCSYCRVERIQYSQCDLRSPSVCWEQPAGVALVVGLDFAYIDVGS